MLYKINPLKNDEESLKAFEFIGRFIAMAVNTDNYIDFTLSSALWNELLGGQEIKTIEDLESEDPEYY